MCQPCYISNFTTETEKIVCGLSTDRYVSRHNPYSACRWFRERARELNTMTKVPTTARARADCAMLGPAKPLGPNTLLRIFLARNSCCLFCSITLHGNTAQSLCASFIYYRQLKQRTFPACFLQPGEQ